MTLLLPAAPPPGGPSYALVQYHGASKYRISAFGAKLHQTVDNMKQKFYN